MTDLLLDIAKTIGGIWLLVIFGMLIYVPDVQNADDRFTPTSTKSKGETVKFQQGDQVLYDGKVCEVRYANTEIVVFRRNADGHLMMLAPWALEQEQVPWVFTIGGWWSQMRDVPERSYFRTSDSRNQRFQRARQ